MRKLDLFFAVNIAGFLALCVLRYHDRFVAYRGAGHLEEFLLYALVILTGILVLWRSFRLQDFSTLTLGLVEVGILMHFAGALVSVGEGRLYDVHLLGIRYDKYVHLTNAFTVAMLVTWVLRLRGIRPDPLNRLLAVLVVLGLGAIVEIVEYGVVLTIPGNGVGDYHNNMQDLVANLAGATAFVAVEAARAVWKRRWLRGRHMPADHPRGLAIAPGRAE